MVQQNKQELWAALEAHNLPSNRLLYELSGLLSDDLQKFESFWTSIHPAEQLQLVTVLSEIAEADFEMDFSDIFHIALDASEPEIVIMALEGLAESEDIRLIPRLINILKMDSNYALRAKAAENLAGFVRMGEFGRIREPLFIGTVAVLIDTFRDPSENIEVRRRALEAVAFTAINGIPELIQTAYDSSDEKLAISAVFAMGRSADERWSPQIRKEMNSLHPEMRFEATRACGELQLTEAISDLIEMTDDVDSQVQEMAIWSLGQIGGQRARHTLEQLVKSENEALQSAAQQALDELEFYQTDTSTFLGSPNKFSGEGEESWFTPEGYLMGDDTDDDLDDDDLNDFVAEDDLWDQGD